MSKKLSKAEQETWETLSTPYVPPKSLEDEISEALSKEIAKEIDKEILEALMAEARK